MKKIFKVLPVALVACLLSGCATKVYPDEFVEKVTAQVDKVKEKQEQYKTVKITGKADLEQDGTMDKYDFTISDITSASALTNLTAKEIALATTLSAYMKLTVVGAEVFAAQARKDSEVTLKAGYVFEVEDILVQKGTRADFKWNNKLLLTSLEADDFIDLTAKWSK